MVRLGDVLRGLGVARVEPPKGTVFSLVYPDTALLIYGETKVGKTRIAAVEAAKLARVVPPHSFVGIFTEPNLELEDIEHLLSICLLHRVSCELTKITTVRGLVRVVRKYKAAIRRRGESLPRVVVFDSVTALSQHVTADLDDNMLTNPSAIVGIQNQPQAAILTPLRTALSTQFLNGYLIITAHETKTRGEPYNPDVPDVKAKPRYASAAVYHADAELRVSFDKGRCRGDVRKVTIVRARRRPGAVGASYYLRLKRSEYSGVRAGMFYAVEDGYVYFALVMEEHLKTFKPAIEVSARVEYSELPVEEFEGEGLTFEFANCDAGKKA